MAFIINSFSFSMWNMKYLELEQEKIREYRVIRVSITNFANAKSYGSKKLLELE